MPSVKSLSADPPTESRKFIELTKAASLPNDRLPASFVEQWPTWILDTSTSDWMRVPDSDGFVPPASIDELWQPADLKPPHCRLAVGLHVRDGTLRHVLPAVDLSFNGEHRNRGLCSVPRAYQWMDFANLALGGGLDACRLVLQSREMGEPEKLWTTIETIDSVGEIISSAVNSLAEDPPDALSEGSNVVHVLCDTHDNDDATESQTIPKVGSDLRALLLEEDGTILGALQVAILQTAAGSESEYLPEAYEPLFKDESLRRPAFTEMRRRMQRKDT